MNWKLIVLLAGCGVVMGIASVLGFTSGIEGFLWLAIGIISVLVIVKKATARFFLHGFFVGLIGGAVAQLIQFLFFSRYMASNPDLAKSFTGIPGGMDAWYFVLMLASIIGLVSGFILGLLCWVAAKLVARSQVAA